MTEEAEPARGHPAAAPEGPEWAERLAAEGSFRASWLYGPKARGRAQALCFGLGAWETAHATGGGATATPLLDDWAARASDPEALLRHVESFFVLRRDTPTASFLQSVGLLPGAHAEGCFRAGA